MLIKQLTTTDELSQWAEWAKNHPQGSLWQSSEWKNYQESLGRETRVYACFETPSAPQHDTLRLVAAALVIIDRTAFGLSTWDIPRGPVLAMSDERTATSLMDKIKEDAKLDTCMSIYLSPLIANHLPLTASNRHEQPEATRILNLTLSDEDLLKQMHEKGRYNIRVAQKNGVRVEQSNAVDTYYQLAQKTGGRDGFGIPSKKQLQTFLNNIPGSFLFLAYKDTTPVAGLIGVIYRKKGIYYYGASDYEHRALMAPYLLQWEAIKHCKNSHCTTYDLLGIAPVQPPTLNSQFSILNSSHPWQGISSFKEKFGGTVVTYPPEQEITLKPVIKKLLEIKRSIIG